MTREPEMVQAYRDAGELGLRNGYLTYLRDRFLISRDLLSPSGSIFVQISDENLHHVREVMDEVFGGENFLHRSSPCPRRRLVVSNRLERVAYRDCDYLIWYARDSAR